ncbi:hypothetical protein [Defluviimonas salinarum]|uniref:Uncharacterized protein n=1 Tax=Defluviimonas salinarum TaxID=2992147 RepID=A0ABT3J5C6_9RHOB|nr:hypothetical protein [Defluviimonas salinarum]MCW3782901.1 hypothetical protein [Defluviimonas salinarum]
MSNDRNLVVSSGQRMNRIERPEEIIDPGTWWRVAEPAKPASDAGEALLGAWSSAKTVTESIRSKQWAEGQSEPDHGLVLLLKEVREVDGEIHTLVFEGHPGWRHAGNIRMLRQDFALCMIHEPDGAEMRKSEEDRLMGRIELLTHDMARPPAEAEVQAIVARKEAEEEEKAARERQRMIGKTGPDPDDAKPEMGTAAGIDADRASLVPAALLPSRDLQMAERVVKTQMRIAEAHSELMQAKVEKVRRGMDVVTRFQEEKVATALAGISKQRKFAETMLGSVHTMKLWLGEGVGISKMTDGAGAARDEKIRFMQQLLYLDEEIFVEDMLGRGFDAGDLADLPRLLTANPEMVSRMLPYERCVAITRVRRKERQFEMPTNMAGVLEIFAKSKADKLIQIFVRDGERVTMITADDETSGARRLFPSTAEIDGIFTSNDWNDRGRTIDMRDIRYTDSREKHDQRALFYKRFLLILWGAHEREGVFGSLPDGMNWLTEETHRARFDFIHDEEYGIGDGSLPVRDWIAGHNARIRAGSRVVATWSELISEETAPGAYSNHVLHQRERNRAPLANVEIVTVQRKGDELTSVCQTEARYNWEHEGKTFNVNVRLCDRVGDPRALQGDGLICIDHMTSREMEAYANGRRHRESYASWLGQIKLAIPEVRARERLEEALVNRIRSRITGLDAATLACLPAVAHEAILAAGWEMPDAARDAKLVMQAQILARLDGTETGEDIQVRLRANGEILRLRPAPVLFGGRVIEPFWIQEGFTMRAGGGLVSKSSRIITAAATPDAGDILVASRADSAMMAGYWKRGGHGLPGLADRALVEDLQSPERIASSLEFLSQAERPTEAVVAAWLRSVIHHNRYTRSVEIPLLRTVIGVAVIPNDDRLGTDSLQVVCATVDPVYHAWLTGHHAAVDDFLNKLYKHPATARGRLEERRTAGHRSATVWFSLDSGSGGLKMLHDAALKGHMSEQRWIRFDDVEVTLRGDSVRVIPSPGPGLAAGISQALLQSLASYRYRPTEADLEQSLARYATVDLRIDPRVEAAALRLVGMMEGAEPGRDLPQP